MKTVEVFKMSQDIDSDDLDDEEDNKLLESDVSQAFLEVMRAAKNKKSRE